MSPHGVNGDDPDYVEIWNLVFMQFERRTMQPLPRHSVDTGMGLERIAVVLQGVHSTYEDLFRPIVERTIALAGADESHYRAHRAAYHVIADHTRACAFLIADGIVPGNEGAGSYVLRRLLRCAAYQGRTIGLSRSFLAQTAEVVIDLMQETYPELQTRRAAILDTLTAEEERFSRTISRGITVLERALPSLPPREQLPGSVAFTLYDTYGFPLDLTQKIVAEYGRTVDQAGVAEAMEQQRQRSRAAAQAWRGAS